MKANYLLRNRSRQAHVKQAIMLVVIFIFGALVFSFMDSLIISIISPVWRADNTFSRSLRDSLGYFQTKQGLINENTALKEQLADLEAKLLLALREDVEMESLLELLGRKPSSNAVAATVLTHPPQTPYDVIVVDAGTSEALSIGAEVFLPEGPRIGKISEIFSNQARVKLFSATGEETNALLERNNIPVVLVGVGGGNFTIKLPRDIAVEDGDAILSTDLSPKLLAVVEEVHIESTDSFKEVLASSPANIFTLRYVFITP